MNFFSIKNSLTLAFGALLATNVAYAQETTTIRSGTDTVANVEVPAYCGTYEIEIVGRFGGVSLREAGVLTRTSDIDVLIDLTHVKSSDCGEGTVQYSVSEEDFKFMDLDYDDNGNVTSVDISTGVFVLVSDDNPADFKLINFDLSVEVDPQLGGGRDVGYGSDYTPEERSTYLNEDRFRRAQVKISLSIDGVGFYARSTNDPSRQQGVAVTARVNEYRRQNIDNTWAL